MQLLVNASLGALCGIGLYLIGIPYAALWGAVAGLLRIIPYFGSLVATLLPLLLSLAVFDHWMPPLFVFLLFATLEVVTGNFVEPWLYGRHMGISALALLLTTLFWVALWGPARRMRLPWQCWPNYWNRPAVPPFRSLSTLHCSTCSPWWNRPRPTYSASPPCLHLLLRAPELWPACSRLSFRGPRLSSEFGGSLAIQNGPGSAFNRLAPICWSGISQMR